MSTIDINLTEGLEAVDAENETADAAKAGGDPSSDRSPQAALKRGVDCLLRYQTDEGYWCAELEGDSILQSEYLLMKWILGQEDDPRLPAVLRYMRRQQVMEGEHRGAWVQYPGGAIDVSASVKAYLCLKLAGDDIDAPHMVAAREAILAAGGAEKCNSFSKFYLAALGIINYSAVPSIPPEIMYLPKWFYFHIDKVSSWSRTMILPLSLFVTKKPLRQLPGNLNINELYRDPQRRHKLVATHTDPHPFWSKFFLGVDRGLKLLDKLGETPWRKRAMKRMEEWIIAHHQKSDGVGAIFPPMVYNLMVFKALGYADDHELITQGHQDLDDFMLFTQDENGEELIHLQPCFSPIWDTGIAAFALAEAGLDASHPAIKRCTDWLLTKECNRENLPEGFKGDWLANVDPATEPGGWYFEFNNPYYPDTDDTAMVSMAINRLNQGDAGNPKAIEAAKRGAAWDLALQNDDGGWAAFDKTTPHALYDYVPFADHNAMQDPSCPDITGRVLEGLGWLDHQVGEPAIDRAIQYIRSEQDADGCWWGRWGVNFIYGTYQVLNGLKAVGQDMQADWVQRAGQWLKDHQQPDGSFGESPDSYLDMNDRSKRGIGPSTASQTAWGAMGMLAVFGPDDPDVKRAIQWLCNTQLTEEAIHETDGDANLIGNWHEPWFTGTGFPKVFYLRYHYYRLYFPVMAIGRYLRLSRSDSANA